MKALYLLNEQLVDELGKGIPERNSYRWTVIDNLKEAIEELEELKNRSCDGCIHKNSEGVMEYSCFECSRYYSDRFDAEV